jgi:hypothetical protein
MNTVSAPAMQSIDCLQVLVQTSSITAAKLTGSRPPSASPNSLDYTLQVRIIIASNCISPNSLDHSLQVYLQTPSLTASKPMSKLTPLRPPSASPYWLDHSLQVHLQHCSITASKCISKLARLRPPSALPYSIDHGLQVYLQTRSITHSEHISESTPSSCPGTP